MACTEGDVRLLGGPDKFSGILTVFINGALILVCERNFDYRDANVICRQAGFVDRGIYFDTFLTHTLEYLFIHLLCLCLTVSLYLSSWFNTR